MNYKLLLLTAMLLLLLPAVTFAKQRQKVLLADPFILYHDGLYYAYGTGAPDGIEVYTSRNLRSWERRGSWLPVRGRSVYNWLRNSAPRRS